MISATGLTWRQGQEECEKLGGYLAEIKSEMQQAFLVSLKILFIGQIIWIATLKMSIANLEEILINTKSWQIGKGI